MGCIRRESPNFCKGAFQSADHAIDRFRQRAQFVAGISDRQTTVQAVCGDLLRQAVQMTYRPKGFSGQQVARSAGNAESERHGHAEHDKQFTQLMVHFLKTRKQDDSVLLFWRLNLLAKRALVTNDRERNIEEIALRYRTG